MVGLYRMTRGGRCGIKNQGEKACNILGVYSARNEVVQQTIRCELKKRNLYEIVRCTQLSTSCIIT